MTQKYFYYKRSTNPNAYTFKIPLQTARDIITDTVTGKRAFVKILSSADGTVDFTDSIYNKLKRVSLRTKDTNYWDRRDYVYYFDSQIPPLKWLDIYETAILPNYEEKDWANLHSVSTTLFNQRIKHTTIYNKLSDRITRSEETVKRAALCLLDRIQQDYPSPHIKKLTEYITEYQGKFCFNYSTNSHIVLSNTDPSDEINNTVKQLLESLNNYSGWGSAFSEYGLERLDILNHEYFEHLAREFRTRTPRYNHKLKHRDIIVKSVK